MHVVELLVQFKYCGLKYPICTEKLCGINDDNTILKKFRN